MELVKGNIIKEINTNPGVLFKDTIANSELTYKVTKVNKKTYGLVCIEGYMEGSEQKLLKDFKEESIDVYGTIRKWVLIQ